MKVYGYSKCSTCQKAKKYLKSRNIPFDDIDIILNPPTRVELSSILKSNQYNIKELFNRSGVLYREMNMKDKIDKLKETQLLDLLSKNGKLVKRPIVIDGEDVTVGYSEDVFKKMWN